MARRRVRAVHALTRGSTPLRCGFGPDTHIWRPLSPGGPEEGVADRPRALPRGPARGAPRSNSVGGSIGAGPPTVTIARPRGRRGVDSLTPIRAGERQEVAAGRCHHQVQRVRGIRTRVRVRLRRFASTQRTVATGLLPGRIPRRGGEWWTERARPPFGTARSAEGRPETGIAEEVLSRWWSPSWWPPAPFGGE
jgi:hypothetical protein